MARFTIVLALWLTGVSVLLPADPAIAADSQKRARFGFELEGGPVWQSSNDVRIPGDSGTEFSFKDVHKLT